MKSKNVTVINKESSSKKGSSKTRSSKKSSSKKESSKTRSSKNISSNITKNVDHDEIFERLFYNNLNQCDGKDKATYEVVKIIFSSKYESIKPPTLNNVLKNKHLYCEEKIGKEKNETKVRLMKSCDVNYEIPMVDKCNLGKEFYYRSERGKLSLPCPCCSFGGFSKLFDGYDKKTKLSLLTQGKKGSKAAKQVSFTWQDWKYPKGDKYKRLKQSMKRCIAKHFARFMHLEQNLKLVKEENRKHVELGNTHAIYNLPSKWKVNTKEDINEKIDCMTITIDH